MKFCHHSRWFTINFQRSSSVQTTRPTGTIRCSKCRAFDKSTFWRPVCERENDHSKFNLIYKITLVYSMFGLSIWPSQESSAFWGPEKPKLSVLQRNIFNGKRRRIVGPNPKPSTYQLNLIWKRLKRKFQLELNEKTTLFCVTIHRKYIDISHCYYKTHNEIIKEKFSIVTKSRRNKKLGHFLQT